MPGNKRERACFNKLNFTYIENLLFSLICILLCSTRSLELLNLRIDVVDLCTHVLDHLALEFFSLLRLRVSSHQAKKLRIIVKSHICKHKKHLIKNLSTLPAKGSSSKIRIVLDHADFAKTCINHGRLHR